MSNPFIEGKKPREKAIEELLKWLDSYGLRVYGNMFHEDGSETGLHDFDSQKLVQLMRNVSRYE